MMTGTAQLLTSCHAAQSPPLRHDCPPWASRYLHGVQGLGGQHAQHEGQDKEEQGWGTAETTDNEVFVTPRDTGIVFAETNPRGSEGQGCEPMGYNQRFYEIQDAQRVLPRAPTAHCSGPTVPGPALWYHHPSHVYRPPSNPILVPLLCPLPWVGHSEAAVPGPKVAPAVENTEPQALQAACHLVLHGVVSEERLGRLKAEYEARPWDEWTPIFNDTFPSRDRTLDSGDRRVLRATMVADDDDIATHDLPELIATGELICAELDQLFPLRSHKLVVANYVGVTGYTRQHLHRDMRHVPVGSRTLSVFGAIERDITQVDGSHSYFIADSTHGLPQPWHEVPIRLQSKHIGDLCPRCNAPSPEDPTPAAIPPPTTPTPLPFTTACYMPGSNSTFVAI